MLLNSPLKEPDFYKNGVLNNDNIGYLGLCLLCGLSILLFSNSLNYLLSFGSAQENTILKILRVMVYTFFIFFTIFLKNKVDVLKAMNVFLVLLLILAMMSTLWSISPKETVVRSYGLIGTTLLGVVLAVRFTWHNFIKLSAYTYLIMIVITLAVCLLLPSVGIHSGDEHSGAWRGAFGHKNIMGRTMLLGFVLLYFGQKLLFGLDKLVVRVCLLGTFSLIILSTSMTSLFVLSLVIILGSLLPILRAYKVIFLFMLANAVIILLILFTFLDVNHIIETLFNKAGRDVTLTGRTEVWGIAIKAWLQHNALLGFGYGGFWETSAGNLSMYWGPSGYIPPHAHNGFIQVATELGFVGLILTVCYFLLCLRKVWSHIFLMPKDVAFFPMIIFTSTLLLSITEVNYLVNRNIIWVFFIYGTIRAEIDLKLTRHYQKKIVSLLKKN